MNIKIIKPKELKKFSATVDPLLVKNLEFANQSVHRNPLLKNVEIEALISLPESEVFIFGSRKTELNTILEKEHFRYLCVMVKVSDADLIREFNESQRFFLSMGLIDDVKHATDHIYLRFRASANSSHERANLAFCEKTFKSLKGKILDILSGRDSD
jgi:hypothetical protein